MGNPRLPGASKTAEEVKRLRQKGSSNKEIALTLGVTLGYVKQIIWRHKLVKRPSEVKDGSMD